jgi:hypothetical protein
MCIYVIYHWNTQSHLHCLPACLFLCFYLSVLGKVKGIYTIYWVAMVVIPPKLGLLLILATDPSETTWSGWDWHSILLWFWRATTNGWSLWIFLWGDTTKKNQSRALDSMYSASGCQCRLIAKCAAQTWKKLTSYSLARFQRRAARWYRIGIDISLMACTWIQATSFCDMTCKGS